MAKNGRESRSLSRPKSMEEPNERQRSSKPLRIKVSDNETLVEDDGALDRLLLVQSGLSTLVNQMDELVAQVFNLSATSGQGREEIESFTRVLSEMLGSLKPWVPRFQKVVSCTKYEKLSIPDSNENNRNIVSSMGEDQPSIPRFQKALSTPCMKNGNPLKQNLATQRMAASNKKDRNTVNSPEEDQMMPLISPSPLVSWRADCTIERGRQLFMLTPVPLSKALSSMHQDFSKSIFDRFTSNADAGVSTFSSTIDEDANDDLLEGVTEKQPMPSKNCSDGTTELLKKTSECRLQKMLPPKSCMSIEPVLKYQDTVKIYKTTPFPRAIQTCDESDMSDSPVNHMSKTLALKYPELFGAQEADKLGIQKKEMDESLDWLTSPLKTCVLQEPPYGNEHINVSTQYGMPGSSFALKQQTNLSSVKRNEYDAQSCSYLTDKNFNPAAEHGCGAALLEGTPLWRKSESSFRMGKHPGETTLKKELWKRFEAASTDGLCYNTSSLKQVAEKGFLDRLDEVSCDDATPIAHVLR